MLANELPALVPSVLMTITARLSTRVILGGVLAVVGLLIGPWLASIHVSWLRGWSPVAILYALSAPILPLLIGSILIPIIGYSYLASRRADAQIQQPDDWT